MEAFSEVEVKVMQARTEELVVRARMWDAIAKAISDVATLAMAALREDIEEAEQRRRRRAEAAGQR